MYRGFSRVAETVARGLTWGAGKKRGMALAAAGWVLSRAQGEPLRRGGDDPLRAGRRRYVPARKEDDVFDQTRTDRKTVFRLVSRGPLHKVGAKKALRRDTPCTWERWHRAQGALGWRPPGRPRALAVGGGLARILVLKHWASDVVAGFALGAALERMLRHWTGYPIEETDDAHQRTCQRIP